MLRIILFINLFCFAQPYVAQDYLYLKDNSKLAVRVSEIGINEIKYKPFDNLNGPIYVMDKKDVSVIIFENGMHEVINSKTKGNQAETTSENHSEGLRGKDSLSYYRYNNSIAFNTIGLINNELSFLYQREFYARNFNIVLPFSFGISSPLFTKYLYFNNLGNLQIDRKKFEIGLGVNYYGSRKKPVNYYIGPLLKYMLFDASQNFNNFLFSSSTSQQTMTQHIDVHTLSASITNGIIIRSQSRFMMNIFGSMGYRYAYLTQPLVDPFTQKELSLNYKEVQFYFWAGVAIAYSF